MSEYFEVKLNNKDITETLERYVKAISDIKPAFRIARRHILNAIEDNFETEGQSSGEKFKDWSEKYAKQRTKKGRGEGKILQLEGHLKNSLSSKITRDELIVGTNKEYAAAHQFGYAPRNLDARPFMRISDQVKQDIMNDIAYDMAKRNSGRT